MCSGEARVKDATDHFDRDFNVVYLRVVRGCNLNCTHCFTLGNRDAFRLADLGEIELFLTTLRERLDTRQNVFYIHGGEPFLAPKAYLAQVNALIRRIFAGRRFDIIPQTNLMYPVDAAFADFLKREYAGQIGVSWDPGIRFETGSPRLGEELFFRNFRFLADAGIEMAVAITVQRHLLKTDPLEVVRRLDGAKSVDFEFLTFFDEKTRDLRVSNVEWSRYFASIVRHYAENRTSWALPQVDLFTKSFVENKIYQCKCNCCRHRTFTMNADATVGLCPDETYIRPLSTVREMAANWPAFAAKALGDHVEQLATPLQPLCTGCEFFDVCGGNCEAHLFNENEAECPLSLAALRYQREHLAVFRGKLDEALERLPELKKESPVTEARP